MNSSLLTGFIKITFAGKDRKKPLALKGVFYRGLTIIPANITFFIIRQKKIIVMFQYIIEKHNINIDA
jgi:hypothetical protein